MTMDTRSDESLMQAFAQANTEAFNTLYERHKGALYRYFLRQVTSVALAEDLYQECWSRIIKSANRYEPTAKWTTWAYRIAHNLVVDHFRSFKCSESYEEDSNDIQTEQATEQRVSASASEPQAHQDNQQLAQRLKYCIAKLPAVQREAFIFTQETDMTAQVIAEVVDASYEAVKTRIRYAKASLQDCLRAFRESMYSSHSEASNSQGEER